ncbi:uncharacterized protein LOC114516329 [Dendronephthya gigantea]|uniref:uncharacterized protein LOC114516329 n=1 Tax=Dendronephthya gigantea TaxID=151771 RepID=UPI00106BA2BA|nr:uncharacterized protein LOC114516329 [Dendronephthya gigantea]XP_028391570.1 uncharacterized protein LOC114516329 [Dendronephthya gigantea]
MMQFMRKPAEYHKSKYTFMESKPRAESVSGPTSPRRKLSSPSKDESWRSDMLKALQNSANPEPIRIACMKSNVNGPAHFGELFHGTLTRDEVTELLSGGNGRYLVRESNSSPGDHILSFSTGGNILHYKLFYDAETAKYHTESDEKTYNSLTELMVDILNMLRVIHQYGSQINGCGISGNGVEKTTKTKRPSFTKPHSFRIHQYMHPKWCDICHAFMWGLMHQGMKCQDCGLNVHKHCVKDVETNCGTCTVETRNRSESKTKRRGRLSVDQGKSDELYALLAKHITCGYQLECLKYLSSLKQPVANFDLATLMNPCYCDNCCHLKDLDTPLCKTGSPPQAYSLPLGWCRFCLNTPKGMAEPASWNVAYYSLSKEMLPSILEKGLGNKADFLGSDGKIFVKLTPSIICADLDSPVVEYQDSDSNELKVAKIALQVYVKPGSFQTMGRAGISTEEIDPYFKSTDIYWVIRDNNSIIPFGILIKRMRMTYRKS